MANVGPVLQCRFANFAWETLEASRASAAEEASVLMRKISVATAAAESEGGRDSGGIRGGISHGQRPIQSWKGENPVDALTEFIK